jgi:hypothetical protein
MTLVLTKVATDGVVMAAESTLTEQYGGYVRFLQGATKLFVHGPSRSCIGTWGAGTLPNSSGQIPIEFVVRRFLDEAVAIETADNLVSKLIQWLGENFGTTNGIVGLDIASTKPSGTQTGVVVYRLLNSNNLEGAPRRWFTAQTMRAPGIYGPDDRAILPPGGDINSSFWVDELRSAMRNSLRRTQGRELPEDCESTAAWLSAIVRSVADSYRCFDLARSVGSEVTAVVLRQGEHAPETRRA